MAQRDVVQISADDHPALASRLERELLQAVSDHGDALISAQDWPDFQKRRGTILGLLEAIDICKKVNEKLKA